MAGGEKGCAGGKREGVERWGGDGMDGWREKR